MAEEITKDSEYKGTRIMMDARMDNVRLRIQIDFGVGDVMVPGPRMIEYPVFLGSETIKLLAYPVESAIAEMGDDQLIDAFGKVLEDLKIFAMPVFRSLARGEKLTRQWKAGKGWESS